MFKDTLFKEIVIEVTRRCNMTCPHCLRGDMQNMDANLEYIDLFLRNFRGRNIARLFFTGGEPTLRPDIIEYTVKRAEQYDIYISKVDLITNGKNISEDFIDLANRFYEKYDFEVRLSLDDFHEPLTESDYEKLSKVPRLSSLPYMYKDDSRVLKAGRARDNKIGIRDIQKLGLSTCIYKDYLLVDSTLVLTCTGKVLIDCDYEFEDENKNLFCMYNDNIFKEIHTQKRVYKLEYMKKLGYFYRFMDELEKAGRL